MKIAGALLVAFVLLMGCGNTSPPQPEVDLLGLSLRYDPASLQKVEGQEPGTQLYYFKRMNVSCDNACPQLLVANASSNLFKRMVQGDTLVEPDGCSVKDDGYEPPQKTRSLTIGGEPADFYESKPCPHFTLVTKRVAGPRSAWLVPSRQLLILMLSGSEGSSIPGIEHALSNGVWK